MKTVQLFNPDAVAQGKQMSTEQICRFLEDFRLMHGHNKNGKSKLISIKVPENLLSAFRYQCDLKHLKYQTQIKQLMVEWLKERS